MLKQGTEIKNLSTKMKASVKSVIGDMVTYKYYATSITETKTKSSIELEFKIL